MSAASSRHDWDEAERVLRSMPYDASVLLVCHVNPDGDALGSMLGFAIGLRSMGYQHVVAAFSGPFDLPVALCDLPGLDLLVAEDGVSAVPGIVLAFDAASLARLGTFAEAFEAAPVTIVLDHHASNTRFGHINLVDPSAPATAVLVERLLIRLGVTVDPAIAECLYVALVTDTGSFRYNCTPAAHELAARLIGTGIPAGEIAAKLFDSRPFGAVRLFGDVLSRAVLDQDAVAGKGLVWTYATLDDLSVHDQRPQELEAIIDLVRCSREAEVACLLKQVAAGEWAVSLRSKGAVDVSALAVSLGGGGHRAAAGFNGFGTVEDIIGAVVRGLDVGTDLAAADHC